MKSKLLALLALLGFSTFMTGCVSTVDGHMKAGLPSKDTLEAHYERSLPQVFQAARVVLARNGTLMKDDSVGNAIVAKIDTRTVYVRMDEINPKVTRVLTQVRDRNMTGDIDLAAEIDKQIALQLSAQQ